LEKQLKTPPPDASQAWPHSAPVAKVLNTGPDTANVISACRPRTTPNLDEATLQLEKLVEETHQALVRDGLLAARDASDGYERHVGAASAAPTAYRRSPSAPEEIILDSTNNTLSIPSLDAVDSALEELRRGLLEIDGSIAMHVPAPTAA